MDLFAPWHLVILAVVFMLLFGSRRLPDSARSLGRSLRIFKTEMKKLHDDDEPADQARAAQASVQAGQPAPLPPTADTTATTGVPLADPQRNQQPF
jgi:sec-independent protein translocase protein TatA